MNLVFYDGSCGFCDHVVQFLLKIDTKGLFVFAPLQGITAKKLLKNIPPADSLVLIEDYNSPDRSFYQFGKAAFRILWLIGGLWALLGWVSFLPPILYNWGYRLIARNRHAFSPKTVASYPILISQAAFFLSSGEYRQLLR